MLMANNEYVPDFSGDDFADNKEIQRQREEIKAYEEMIEDVLDLVQRVLGVQKSAHMNFKRFHMFKSLSATVTHSMESVSPDNNLRVCLAEYDDAFPTAKSANSGTDLYLFGHISLQSSYPRTYIHKETVKEKIEDLFLKRDVDFSESKKFSGKFQVLTEDKSKIQSLLQFKNLDDLVDFAELELELYENGALFRSSRKPISIEQASIFCNLSKTLLTIFT